jgi:tetraacyldisaccharide 4'-kinase
MLRDLFWNDEERRARPWARPALWPASLAYRVLLAGWSKWGARLGGGRRRLPVPVVSVGNIVVGGTGKTPTAWWIAARLAAAGRRPVILSRGYGGRAGRGPVVVSEGGGALCDQSIAGDEPVMLARRGSGVRVVVGSDRYACGMHAVEALGADCAILDDGFQHLALHRDLDLLLMDSTRPLGSGGLLPDGTLREPFSAVSRADLVIFTRWSERLNGREDRARVEAVVGGDRIVTASHAFAGLADASAPETARGVEGARVLLVSGIADWRAFERTAAGAGIQARDHVRFGDHHKYTRADLELIARRARETEASAVLTTEKDAVRLPARIAGLDAPILYLRVELKIEKGLAALCEALDRLFI